MLCWYWTKLHFLKHMKVNNLETNEYIYIFIEFILWTNQVPEDTYLSYEPIKFTKGTESHGICQAFQRQANH